VLASICIETAHFCVALKSAKFVTLQKVRLFFLHLPKNEIEFKNTNVLTKSLSVVGSHNEKCKSTSMGFVRVPLFDPTSSSLLSEGGLGRARFRGRFAGEETAAVFGLSGLVSMSWSLSPPDPDGSDSPPDPDGSASPSGASP
jgi:hypothetical protein